MAERCRHRGDCRFDGRHTAPAQLRPGLRLPRPLLYEGGDNDHALADADRAIALSPDSYIAYFARGAVNFLKKDYAQALSDFGRAILINPDSFFSYKLRGVLYHVKGEYDRALADFSDALRRNPDDAELYNMRAMTKSALNDDKGALDDLNKAFALAPDYLRRAHHQSKRLSAS